MSGRDFTEHDVHLALDGELPAEERPAFERWLETHPDMRALSRRFESDRARLQEALEPVLSEPLPPSLAAAGPPRRQPWRGPWFRAAAAVLLVVLGGAGGYALGAGGWFGFAPPAGRIGSNAIAAHLIYANEKRHVVEVAADQEEHLVGWLSNRLGTELVAPDFSAAGYSLVGGRLLPADGRAAAQFMYERADGDRISLYVTRDPEHRKSGFRLRREEAGCAYYWLGNGYGYVVAGTSSEETLLALAVEAQRQLSAAGG
jgi:anti-sigma factor RsiW